MTNISWSIPRPSSPPLSLRVHPFCPESRSELPCATSRSASTWTHVPSSLGLLAFRQQSDYHHSSLANNARGKERRGIDRFGPKTVHDETTFLSSSSVCGDYLRFRFEFLSRLRGDGRGRPPSLLLTKIRQEGIPLCEDKSYECTRERFTGIDKMSSRGGLDGNLDRFELPGWIPRRNETVSRISNVIPGIEQSLSRPLPSKRARYYDLQRRRKLELLGYFSAVRPSPQFLDGSRFLNAHTSWLPA